MSYVADPRKKRRFQTDTVLPARRSSPRDLALVGGLVASGARRTTLSGDPSYTRSPGLGTGGKSFAQILQEIFGGGGGDGFGLGAGVFSPGNTGGIFDGPAAPQPFGTATPGGSGVLLDDGTIGQQHNAAPFVENLVTPQPTNILEQIVQTIANVIAPAPGSIPTQIAPATVSQGIPQGAAPPAPTISLGADPVVRQVEIGPEGDIYNGPDYGTATPGGTPGIITHDAAPFVDAPAQNIVEQIVQAIADVIAPAPAPSIAPVPGTSLGITRQLEIEPDGSSAGTDAPGGSSDVIVHTSAPNTDAPPLYNPPMGATPTPTPQPNTDAQPAYTGNLWERLGQAIGEIMSTAPDEGAATPAIDNAQTATVSVSEAGGGQATVSVTPTESVETSSPTIVNDLPIPAAADTSANDSNGAMVFTDIYAAPTNGVLGVQSGTGEAPSTFDLGAPPVSFDQTLEGV